MITPRLNLFSSTMAVVSMVIGIGIFRNASIVAQSAHDSFTFFSAWILGGFVALCGAFTYAEIGSRKPVAGGYYKIVADVYHPSIAFMFNWSYVVENICVYTLVAMLGAEYLTGVFPPGMFGESSVKWFALGIILLLGTINYFGIKVGSTTLNLITVMKIAVILLFAGEALFWISGAHTEIVAHKPAETFHSNFFMALGAGMIPVFFCFGGYQNTMNIGADIINAKRNMPRAILIGMLIVTALYLVINYGYVSVMGMEGVSKSPLIAKDVSLKIFGDWGTRFISAVIFLSALGYLNATLIHLPRGYHAMANDGLLPRWMGKVNPKTQAQEIALILVSVLGGALVFFTKSFEDNLDFIMLNDTLILAVVASTIFLLRKNKVGDNPYRLPLYPVLPVLYILVSLYVTASAFYKTPMGGLYSMLIFLAGYPIYRLLKGRNRK